MLSMYLFLYNEIKVYIKYNDLFFKEKIMRVLVGNVSTSPSTLEK